MRRLLDIAGPGHDNTPDAVAVTVGLGVWGVVQTALADVGPLLPVIVAVLSAVASRAGVAVVAAAFDRLEAWRVPRAAVPRHLPVCSTSCAEGCPIAAAPKP
jgi:hypothetical protein